MADAPLVPANYPVAPLATNGMPPAIAAALDAYLAAIAAVFQPEARVTLLVRSPQIPDGSGDLLLTTDTLPELRRTLDRLAREGRWNFQPPGSRAPGSPAPGSKPEPQRG